MSFNHITNDGVHALCGIELPAEVSSGWHESMSDKPWCPMCVGLDA